MEETSSFVVFSGNREFFGSKGRKAGDSLLTHDSWLKVRFFIYRFCVDTVVNHLFKPNYFTFNKNSFLTLGQVHELCRFVNIFYFDEYLRLNKRVHDTERVDVGGEIYVYINEVDTATGRDRKSTFILDWMSDLHREGRGG